MFPTQHAISGKYHKEQEAFLINTHIKFTAESSLACMNAIHDEVSCCWQKEPAAVFDSSRTVKLYRRCAV